MRSKRVKERGERDEKDSLITFAWKGKGREGGVKLAPSGTKAKSVFKNAIGGEN